jgi:hypothetical protein
MIFRGNVMITVINVTISVPAITAFSSLTGHRPWSIATIYPDMGTNNGSQFGVISGRL